jgi:hypothetical protein
MWYGVCLNFLCSEILQYNMWSQAFRDWRCGQCVDPYNIDVIVHPISCPKLSETNDCIVCVDSYSDNSPQGGGNYYAPSPPQAAPGPPPPQWGGQAQFPGQQYLNDPMANMAMQYGSNLADQGKDLVNKKVCAMNSQWIYKPGMCFECLEMCVTVPSL